MGRRRIPISRRGKVVARYDYADEHGAPLYQVRRHDPKRFSVHTAAGKRLQQRDRHRRVPYRLPDLIRADPAMTVFVVEGEKDVERLWSHGLVATCNAFGGGEGKWSRGHSHYLRGRNVVILPDNDKTGIEHGECVARSLHRIAGSVRVLKLDGLPAKGDVSDWFDAGHSARELENLACTAPVWQPSRPRLQRRRWWEDPDRRVLHHEWSRDRICNLKISAAEKLLLILLADFEEPPQEDLARFMSLSPRRVRQMIQSLKKRRAISVRKRGRRNVYD